MSFFRRQNPRSARPPWESFATVEDPRTAPTMAGADTDEARELLRAARSHFNRIDQAREQAARRREALEHRRELSRETAAMSAASSARDGLRGRRGPDRDVRDGIDRQQLHRSLRVART